MPVNLETGFTMVLLSRVQDLACAIPLADVMETMRTLPVSQLSGAPSYVTGVSVVQEDDRTAAAVEGYRTAVYLDPNFAMPHLRLALVLKGEGELEAARFEFEQASRLIGREDPVRLLVYSNGYGRQALLDQCRAELLQYGDGI